MPDQELASPSGSASCPLRTLPPILASLSCPAPTEGFPDSTPTRGLAPWVPLIIWPTSHLHRCPVAHRLRTAGLGGQNRSGHSRWQGLDVPGPGHFQSHRSRHNRLPRQPAGSTDWVTPKTGAMDMGGVAGREVGIGKVRKLLSGFGIGVGSWVGS